MVVFTGTFALAIQFFFTPKYALNTYAIIPDSWDSWWMQVIFCIHECFFMYHGYSYQACTMVVAECMANSYQHLLQDMTKSVYKLIQAGDSGWSKTSFQTRQEYRRMQNPDFVDGTGNDQNGEAEQNDGIRNRALRRQITFDEACGFKPIRRYLHEKTKAPGTQYDILELINDYRKIIICSNEHNKWIGRLMGGAQAANYAQFVSDVFIMIQLLKEPDIDLFGICFYLMDACFGMCMLFRMLILLSRMSPASDGFVRSIRCYAMYDTPLRKMIIKTLPTLRRVAPKLSGLSIKPESVPVGANILINWYIAAAMWT